MKSCGRRGLQLEMSSFLGKVVLVRRKHEGLVPKYSKQTTVILTLLVRQ